MILTLREVAEYLKVSRSTVYRLVAYKQLPAFKVGHDWRFDSGLIERWLMDQQQAMSSTRDVEPSERLDSSAPENGSLDSI